MSISEPDLGLSSNLSRLAALVKGWPGNPIDAAATVFAAHPEAGAVPVYWCFNAAAEFVRLGEAFGAGQPLVGMRSLNQIMPVNAEASLALDSLARHYADSLLARFGMRACIVGGNCQAAGIAWRVARHLRAAGVPVQRLVVLDAEPRVPYPGTIRLLFGAQSAKYNPFLTEPTDPQRGITWHWQRAWHRFDTRIVPGGHGEYFRAENLGDVARAILEPAEPASALTQVQARSLAACRSVRCTIAQVTPSATTVELVADRDFRDIQGLAVLPLWYGPDGGLRRVPTEDWVVPVAPAPVLQLAFPNPTRCADARLVPVLCMAGYGPLG